MHNWMRFLFGFFIHFVYYYNFIYRLKLNLNLILTMWNQTEDPTYMHTLTINAFIMVSACGVNSIPTAHYVN